METIMDRLLLALGCVVIMIMEDIRVFHVIGLLSSVIISCVILYFPVGAVWVRTAFAAVYAAFCIPFPQFIWAAPITAYELCYQKRRYYFLYLIPFLFPGREYGLFPFDSDKKEYALLFLFALAFALEEKTKISKNRKENYQRMQDALLDLKEKEKRRQLELSKQQDADIHLATLAERNRIAREIHDNIGHMLSRSILQVGAIKAVNAQESLKSGLAALHETLNAAMDSVRESVHDLKDEAFDLEAAIHKMIAEYPAFSIRFHYDLASQTNRNIKYCFAAVISEALTNAAKHSNATKLRIVLREHPALYQLLIEDNGTKRKKMDGRGIGLENMKERAEAFGGSFYVNQEKGFRIFMSIPKTEEMKRTAE